MSALMKEDYTVTKADLSDIDAIEAFLYPDYFNETAFNGLEYDKSMTKAQIASWIQNDVTALVKFGNEIAGLGVMQIMNTFYKQMEADIAMFVIGKKFRSSGVSRILANTLCQIAEHSGASVVYSSCLSGINEKNENLYANLFAKFGFKKLGIVMMRNK